MMRSMTNLGDKPAAAAIEIRPMEQADLPELLRLMHAIVAYERGSNFNLDEQELMRRGFGNRPEFGAFVADGGDRRLTGMAVHYEIPFMHSLQPLLMMKWLFVDPEYRGTGIGKLLFQRMAVHAKSIGHDKFCWFVLKDNANAQAFYRSVGATPDPEWDRWMISAPALTELTR
ncbi:GNAT family N-acetyltransferase [Bradyrhizobium sp. UFLA 03-164]|uniref:GNAT family N-acetyltransferase n=2 Tax=Bradyrhizobium uaiense TaxID=2594946 RepID=A0A6P1BJR1_9BRAD|nr:GNAT family N-acetyltransferase [Bradyrhizobium uaiense]